jgi:hypothetical protein
VLYRHPAARMVIPPRSTTVLSDSGTTQRDDHLRSIQDHGHIGWQRRSGYGRRSLVETAMYRYKTIIGRRLHARSLPNQKTEAKIACSAFNRMTGLGMAVSVRIKSGASRARVSRRDSGRVMRSRVCSPVGPGSRLRRWSWCGLGTGRRVAAPVGRPPRCMRCSIACAWPGWCRRGRSGPSFWPAAGTPKDLLASRLQRWVP